MPATTTSSRRQNRLPPMTSFPPARRLRNHCRGSRPEAFRRRTPAHRHRTRHAQGRADPACSTKPPAHWMLHPSNSVQAALDRLTEGRTTLVIAHQPRHRDECRRHSGHGWWRQSSRPAPMTACNPAGRPLCKAQPLAVPHSHDEDTTPETGDDVGQRRRTAGRRTREGMSAANPSNGVSRINLCLPALYRATTTVALAAVSNCCSSNAPCAARKNRDRVDERRGIPSIERPRGPLVWIHAASIGEAQSVLALDRPYPPDHPQTSTS